MSAIEVTGVTDTTSRISLKKAMEQFGEVDYCHMGNRGVDMPIVRFRTQGDAEKALEHIKAGQVWLDGFVIGGDWKGSRPVVARPQTRGGGGTKGGHSPESRGSMDMTSRDLLSARLGQSRERDRKSRSRHRRRRSRSRSHGRRRRDD
mmetsp:Transcript_6237/g.17571  ORF Transcript_6237/g.17571 Transcript_6237/m.17571 type:complete len:148 (-) Transcript_6237:94-537(-)